MSFAIATYVTQSVAAFLVGVLWAVSLFVYDVLGGRFASDADSNGIKSLLQTTGDVLFVGGGSGAALYATHYHLSSLAYGVVGYVGVGGILLLWKYRSTLWGVDDRRKVD